MNNEFIVSSVGENEENNDNNNNNDTKDNYINNNNSITYDSLLKEMESRENIHKSIHGETHYKGNDYLEHDMHSYQQETGSGIDLNINNYSLDELFDLIGLNAITATIALVFEHSYKIKQDFKEQKIPQMANFIDEVEELLIYELEHDILPSRENLQNYDNADNSHENGDGDGDELNEAPQKGEAPSIAENDDDDDEKDDKNEYNPGETLIPFNTQNNDGVNGLLRENVTRIISIDSFFRNNALPSLQNITYSSIGDNHTSLFSTTNFVSTLSEPVPNITQMSLETVHIPNTFYNIDSAYGNNAFAFRFTDVADPNPLRIVLIEPGNYTNTTIAGSIVNEINTVFAPIPPITTADIYVNTTNGKMTFNLSRPFEIVFYDNDFYTFYQNENINIPPTLPKLNYNLGWLLGFRDPIYTRDSVGNNGTYNLIGESIIDLRGPRYFIIAIDDFNNSHLNKTVITSENRIEKPQIPSYSRSHLNIDIRDGVPTYQQVVNGSSVDHYPINGTYPFFTRPEEKKLTQAQLFSLNQITKERQKEIKHRVESPTEKNVFAIIPNTLHNSNDFRNAIVLTSNQLQENTRHYFGKVNIERVATQLYDDRGNLVNLNGTDWSFTLRVLCSYNVNKPTDYLQYSHNIHY